MTNKNSFSLICRIILVTVLLTACVLVSHATVSNETPLVNVTGAGNLTRETPPPVYNQTSHPPDAGAVEKAFSGWYTQGTKALAAGNNKAASDAFAAALRLNNSSPEARKGYAQALSALGRNGEALDLYRNLSPEDGSDTEIRMGKELNAVGKYDDALATFQNLTARDPQNTECWNQLAAAYAGKSRYEEALVSVRKSLQLSVNQSAGWGWLGAILFGQGRFYEAMASFEKSIALNPENDQAQAGLGDTLSVLGDNDGAISAYEAATRIKPEKKEYWQKSALLYTKLGRWEEGVKAAVKGGLTTQVIPESVPVIRMNNSSYQTENRVNTTASQQT